MNKELLETLDNLMEEHPEKRDDFTALREALIKEGPK